MRIGLGCMRLSTEPARDEELALATLTAALDAGVRVFDTARAYAIDETELGHNERLVARALRLRGAPAGVRVVTKCGMRRDGGTWMPDGRATRIASDVAGSLEALAGVPIDLLLLHAPDPRVSLATTGRALARSLREGLVRAVGVSNVSRKQVEQLASEVPISAVEVALGAYDDLALRSGVVAWCIERGIEILAHAPLGGPDRAKRLAKDPVLASVATGHEGAGAAEVFLAYLLAVRSEIVPIVGARRAETVLRFAAAEQIALSEEDLLAFDRRFPALGELRRPRRAVATRGRAEVVLFVGLQGAGKSRAAEAFVARGYERLNRDSAGGSLRAIANALDQRLAGGADRVVLDNTYVTRAARSDVLRVASAHGASVRCMFFDTPLEEAQVNVILRMLERFGRVVPPEEMAQLARTDPAALGPHALSRMTRDLEPPAVDEGFSEIQVVPFVRDPPLEGRAAVVIALGALEAVDDGQLPIALDAALARLPAGTPGLLFAWRPGAADAAIPPTRAIALVRAAVEAQGGAFDIAICPHDAGPPICWCRPPMPGLFLEFARRHAVALTASTLLGRSPSDRRVAAALGMSFWDFASDS